ncbi:MAG: DUF3883 domain-containing protein [Flavobacteriaceae bacterium]|nr:DUF3883 domain-containing protein [Flavobacteriaceae bacterium]
MSNYQYLKKDKLINFITFLKGNDKKEKYSLDIAEYKLGGSKAEIQTTIDFLNEIGVIQMKQKVITYIGNNEKYQIIDDADLNIIVNHLIQSENIFNDELIDYVLNFNDKDGVFSYTPDIDNNFKYRHIRNFLSSIKLIYLNDNKEYCLTKSFQISIHSSRKKFTLDDLHRIQKRNEQIGREAELVVLDYENNKIREMSLDDKYARYVADDLSLGYDIISYTKTNENIIQQIFIEVKTMSIGKGFYWSKNEIITSERLGEAYYLYLLPHDENEYYINDMEIIINPYHKVFHNKEAWDPEPESYYFKKKFK